MPLLMNRTIAAIPHLSTFLADHPRAVAGWGRKPSGWRAGVVAALLRRPVLRLEDGFLRGLDRDGPPLSLLLDDTGVYYDATRPSAMERAIAANAARQTHPAEALALAQIWRAGGLSKYNHHPDPRARMDHPYVLVADQCADDLSLAHGLAGRGKAAHHRFHRMVAAALDEHPDCLVMVKTHPDLLSHGRRGLCRPALLHHPRLRLLDTPSHPARLIAGARAIYTLTSLLGFEGLIWGRPVRCFAMPFYAGWGLTQDEMPAPARRAPARLTDLLHAAFIDLPRYADPASGQPRSAHQAFAHAATALARRRHAALSAATPGATPLVPACVPPVRAAALR